MKIDPEKLLHNYKVVMKVRAELETESDRGCCLMAVSFIDNELKCLLKGKLVGSNKLLKELFEFNGPLGTFSSKIKMAYCLGYISKDIYHDLEIIRKTRNDFGHNYSTINFETENLKAKILQLKGHFHDLTKRPRSIFVTTVISILAQIHSSDLMIESIKEFNGTDTYSPEFIDEVRKQVENLLTHENPRLEIEKNLQSFVDGLKEVQK